MSETDSDLAVREEARIYRNVWVAFDPAGASMDGPMDVVGLAEIQPLIDAIQSARFALHCELMGNESRQNDQRLRDTERMSASCGVELCGEVLVDLATAVAPFAPDQVACKGCHARHPLYGPAKDIADRAALSPPSQSPATQTRSPQESEVDDG